ATSGIWTNCSSESTASSTISGVPLIRTETLSIFCYNLAAISTQPSDSFADWCAVKARFQWYLLQERKLTPGTVEMRISALRFFFKKILKRRDMHFDDLPLVLPPSTVGTLTINSMKCYSLRLNPWKSVLPLVRVNHEDLRCPNRDCRSDIPLITTDGFEFY